MGIHDAGTTAGSRARPGEDRMGFGFRPSTIFTRRRGRDDVPVCGRSGPAPGVGGGGPARLTDASVSAQDIAGTILLP